MVVFSQAQAETVVKTMAKVAIDNEQWFSELDGVMGDGDFIAIGVFNALLAAGLRVPQDIRVVTFSNRGFGPVFPVPLPRIEMDAYADGQKVS